MLNLRNDIPLREDCVDMLQDNFCQIRDLLLESEQILRVAIQNRDRILTREEAAEYLHCDPQKIPHKIPRSRVSNKLLFRQSDVDKFLDERRIIPKH